MIRELPSSNRRIPSLEALIFKVGGFNGAVRRVIAGWQKPFTANQVKVALVRRYPKLIPGEFQIEDILDELVRVRRLECDSAGYFRHAAHRVTYPRFIKARISPRKQQLKFLFR